jgi:hypothetical protein
MRYRHEQNPNHHQPDDLFYVETDIPAGLTLNEYRRSRPRKVSRWQRLRDMAGGAGVAGAQPA